jgi:PKD repeat protein
MQRALPALVLLVAVAACGDGGSPDNQAPTAVFNGQCTGLTCTFTNSSDDPDGHIASSSWDFGDGGTSSEAEPAHVYGSVETFTVTLTVTDNDGATATKTKSMTTTEPTHTALSFTLDHPGGIKATLTSATTCEAHGNTFRFLTPTASVLTTDACYETIGKSITLAGPYDAFTTITAEIVAPPLSGTPSAHVTGSYPTWTVAFEDGVDADYDDVVITVTALQ